MEGVFRRLGLSLPAVLALAVIVVFIIIGLLPGIFAPHSPTAVAPQQRLMPPAWVDGGSMSHLLGTDALGRDVFSRIVHGTRATLIVATMALVAGALVGTLIGVVAGASGGVIDAALMRLVDAVLALPVILYGLLFAVALGPSMRNVVLAIALGFWSRFARVVRGEVVKLRDRDFVLLARISNASVARLIMRHFLPNVLNTLVVLATLQMGQIIITEATLSFLGAGIPPPTPTWGGMVARGREYIETAWWLTVLPGLTIAVVVLALNVAGDWLRDRLDPRLRQV